MSLAGVQRESGTNTRLEFQALERKIADLESQLAEITRNNQIQIAQEIIQQIAISGSSIRHGPITDIGSPAFFPFQLFIEHHKPGAGAIVHVSLTNSGGIFSWKKWFGGAP